MVNYSKTNDIADMIQEAASRPTTMTHVTLFILLAVHQSNHLMDLSPVVEAKVHWAPDLDAARLHGQTMLQNDARIDHVSVLDGQGHAVLGVVHRPTSGAWHSSSEPTAEPIRLNRPHIAYH